MLVHKETPPADPTRVNLDHETEIRYWCAHFKVGPELLRASVLAVGPHVNDVAQRLKERFEDKVGKLVTMDGGFFLTFSIPMDHAELRSALSEAGGRLIWSKPIGDGVQVKFNPLVGSSDS